ncbi:MAG: IS5 family transposase [Candidatus Hydrogenedentales bacterium]|jgi:transposase
MLMLTLTPSQLDWLAERIPDPPRSPFGGRPSADKRKVIQGIFWILDNGAKWKDLPPEFGSKSTVHRWFQRWVREGVFETLMRDAGRLVEERGQYKLYECFVDGTFSKARGGGDGIGCTRVGKGVKIMVLVDARGLPVAVDTMSAAPHECTLVQGLFDFMLTQGPPERIVGDKAYDSDRLDEAMAVEGVEMIAPHRSNRKPENVTQDGRPLRRYARRWTVERTIGWFQNFRRLCIRWEKSTKLFQGFLHLGCALLLLKKVLG